jgi:hypothetical protein
METPAEEPAIDLLGRGKARRHEFDQDHLAGVMLPAGGFDDGRQLKR